ncbi:MAG: hypothetical protein ACKVOW_01560 [Chitinophagaceae bacterium]
MSNDENNIEHLLTLVTTKKPSNEFHIRLSLAINELILSDFDKLVLLLYRLDVDEKKLRAILKEKPGTDAGHTIADLIIERQVQKIKSRQQFSQRDNNISDEEKW